MKKKWIFKQSAAPTLASLAGASNGLWPLAARGLAGIITNVASYFLSYFYNKSQKKNEGSAVRSLLLTINDYKNRRCDILTISKAIWELSSIQERDTELLT